MSILGYDDWKLMSPDDERASDICPFCGAYSRRSCELDEEAGGVCPWEEMQDDEDIDPDYKRDMRMDE